MVAGRAAAVPQPCVAVEGIILAAGDVRRPIAEGQRRAHVGHRLRRVGGGTRGAHPIPVLEEGRAAVVELQRSPVPVGFAAINAQAVAAAHQPKGSKVAILVERLSCYLGRVIWSSTEGSLMLGERPLAGSGSRSSTAISIPEVLATWK